MSVVGWTLLLCLTLLITLSDGATGSKQINHVIPTSPAGTPCPGQPCLTLNQYIASSSTYITSNTVFKLLPGQHRITRSFVARNIESITVEGNIGEISNIPVKIAGVRSRYLLQFINTVDVYIAGIELNDVGISLDSTENVTLHQLVVDGPRTAVSATNTVNTNVSSCILKNTGWTALTLRNTYNTRISNTSVNNTRWDGLDLFNTTKTDILNTFINHTGWNGIEGRQANTTVISSSTVNSTGWNGIEIEQANYTVISSSIMSNTGWDGIEIFNSSQTKMINIVVNSTGWDGIEVRWAEHTVISCSTVKHTGWNGIEIFYSSQTTVMCTHVNNTRWDGIEIRNATQIKLIGTNITNAGSRALDCSYTDEPCAIETPNNISCNCCEDTCNTLPPNYLCPCLLSDNVLPHDVSKQVYYVTPTSPAGTPCPGQPCLTLDQYIASSSTYFTSNTVFKLLPGQHVITRWLVMQDVECMTIEGNIEGKSNPRVQISGGGSQYLLQFINTVDVHIAGIEVDDIGISLEGTENFTLHQVVVNGPSIAINLANTVDTNISRCDLKNTLSTGVNLRNSYNTSISNTSLINTGRNGFELFNTTCTEIRHTFINSTKGNGFHLHLGNHTVIYGTVINNTGCNGIEVRSSNRTSIDHAYVNNTAANGIEVHVATETSVIGTTVNNTGQNGIEFSEAVKTAVVQTTIQSTQYNGIEFDNANNTYIHDTTVINPGEDGIDICNMKSTNIWFKVKVVGARCFRQCTPNDPTIKVECLT